MSISPNLQFFGSLVSASTDLDVLREYILHMDQSLQDAKEACATTMRTMPRSLEAIANDKIDLLVEPFPRLLHAGFIISVLSFLEQELVFFSKSLAKVECLHLKLGDLSGSLIERFKKYCIHVAKLPVPFSDQNWEDLRGVIEIRNCLVHNSGLLVGFSKADTIKAFIKRHEIPKVDANDTLLVGKETSLKVLEIVERFLESVHSAALKKYPQG